MIDTCQKKYIGPHDKAEPFARVGRKATGLREAAGLPGLIEASRITLEHRVVRLFGSDELSLYHEAGPMAWLI